MLALDAEYGLLEVEKITLSSSSESERERQIAALDRIYLMLEKIGFEAEDIECAMSTTKASQLTDLLDWVNICCAAFSCPVS